MKKVKHNQRFFIINNEGFFYKNSDLIKEQTGEKDKYLQYQWVIPMYVYSINKLWNGKENFDLSPVNFGDEKNKNHNNWKWRRSFEYDEIGKTIWNTEDEAWDVYNKKYSDDNKKIYEELRRLRFTQELKPELI